MNLQIKIINPMRILIGLILISVFLFFSYNIYQELSDLKTFTENELTFEYILKIVNFKRAFIHPFVILLALIGFFISRPIGWIFINNLFIYFLIITCLILLPVSNSSWYIYLIALIPIGLILLMHSFKILNFYKIKKGNILTINLIVIILGLLFSILFGYSFLNSD